VNNSIGKSRKTRRPSIDKRCLRKARAAMCTQRKPGRKSPGGRSRSSRCGCGITRSRPLRGSSELRGRRRRRAYFKALRRSTDQDIQSHHRSELAELDAQQAKLWTVVDNPKVSEKNLIAAINAMNSRTSARPRRADQTRRQRHLSHWHRRTVGGAPRNRTSVAIVANRGAGSHL
jgi:hypothetical protein